MNSDSRRTGPGELFIPLKGKQFDGHDFIRNALTRGAAGALVQRGCAEKAPNPDGGEFLILVDDTLKALGDLARFWRDRQRTRVVAITGSNGKTTTKEMTARVLQGKFKVLKTEGNLNNLIGLPLMLLRLSPEHEVAVLEMGMSEPGEIRRLKSIAGPQISLITNVGRAHLEFLGSLEGVARAKGELWEGLGGEDWIAVNLDDPQVADLAAPVPCRKRTFGLTENAEVRAEKIQFLGPGGVRFSLNLGGTRSLVNLRACGRHNIYNALAAATLADILGLSLPEIVSGLERFEPYPGRGKVSILGGNVHLLDDSYNSNPDSLRATLAAFGQMKGKRRGLVVIGDMLELGPGTAAAHEEAGRWIAEGGFDHLFSLGEMAGRLAEEATAAGMEKRRVHVAGDYEEMLQDLARVVAPEDWILVKGSRRMRLERVVEGLKKRLPENGRN